jgi:hypothetical protein
VIVADRENHRLQLFTFDGQYVASWYCHMACGVAVDPAGCIYVGQSGGPNGQFGAVSNIGARIVIFDREGNTIGQLGDGEYGEGPRAFLALHSVAVDSHGADQTGQNAHRHIYHIPTLFCAHPTTSCGVRRKMANEPVPIVFLLAQGRSTLRKCRSQARGGEKTRRVS